MQEGTRADAAPRRAHAGPFLPERREGEPQLRAKKGGRLEAEISKTREGRRGEGRNYRQCTSTALRHSCWAPRNRDCKRS
eukprot:3175200-Pyramimonas_sp.AAC.1